MSNVKINGLKVNGCKCLDELAIWPKCFVVFALREKQHCPICKFKYVFEDGIWMSEMEDDEMSNNNTYLIFIIFLLLTLWLVVGIIYVLI